ncbi:hypothetical protein G3M48_009987 [Beauveria asiatica]|uniref:Uncharacterized protein n=1 Tax=Beauveria asiatica TaxID=1069075 RepID=A0AAW0RHS7_9HYPO
MRAQRLRTLWLTEHSAAGCQLALPISAANYLHALARLRTLWLTKRSATGY